jgi:hypothetical protein
MHILRGFSIKSLPYFSVKVYGVPASFNEFRNTILFPMLINKKASKENKTPQRLSYRHLLVTLCHGFSPRRLRV